MSRMDAIDAGNFSQSGYQLEETFLSQSVTEKISSHWDGLIQECKKGNLGSTQDSQEDGGAPESIAAMSAKGKPDGGFLMVNKNAAAEPDGQEPKNDKRPDAEDPKKNEKRGLVFEYAKKPSKADDKQDKPNSAKGGSKDEKDQSQRTAEYKEKIEKMTKELQNNKWRSKEEDIALSILLDYRNGTGLFTNNAKQPRDPQDKLKKLIQLLDYQSKMNERAEELKNNKWKTVNEHIELNSLIEFPDARDTDKRIEFLRRHKFTFPGALPPWLDGSGSKEAGADSQKDKTTPTDKPTAGASLTEEQRKSLKTFQQEKEESNKQRARQLEQMQLRSKYPAMGMQMMMLDMALENMLKRSEERLKMWDVEPKPPSKDK